MAFTPEELEAMRLADLEIEEDFEMSLEDFELSKSLDRQAEFEGLDQEKQKAHAYNKAYDAANKERRAATKKAWYEANKEKVAASHKAYYEANREKLLAYAKAYMRERRAACRESF